MSTALTETQIASVFNLDPRAGEADRPQEMVTDNGCGTTPNCAY
ncbi:hypothetical protein [Nonomuraea diastatica]|nr:hypothetical protein [Nonomuraea diastatica]